MSQLKAKGMPVEPDGSYNPEKIRKWMLSKLSENVEALMRATANDGDSQGSRAASELVNELGRFRELVDGFKANRGDLFAGVEAKLISVTEDILDSFSRGQIAQMPVRDRLRLIKDFVSSLTSLYT